MSLDLAPKPRGHGGVWLSVELGLALGLTQGLVAAHCSAATPTWEIADFHAQPTPQQPCIIARGAPVMQPQLGFASPDPAVDLVARPDNIEGELSATWTLDCNESKVLLNLVEEPYFIDIYRQNQRHLLALVKIKARTPSFVTLVPYDPTTHTELKSEVLKLTALPKKDGLQRASLAVGKYHPVTLTQNGLLRHSHLNHVKHTATQHVLQQR